MKKLLDFGRDFKGFLRESRAELKKVSWPTKKQVWYSTIWVVFITLVVALYLGLVDSLLSYLLQSFIGKAS